MQAIADKHDEVITALHGGLSSHGNRLPAGSEISALPLTASAPVA
jgi:hypothetical protein